MINLESVVKKTQKYAKSKAGKEKIKEMREKAFDNGTTFGKGNGITSAQQYKEISRMYLSKLIGYGWANPEIGVSVSNIIMDVAGSADIQSPQKESKGTYKVCIIFNKEKLKRNSLLAEDYWGKSYYTGEGIQNILALFNNGYTIEKEFVPFGLWETHNIPVRAKPHRDKLDFMQKSINEFLIDNKKKYNIKAIHLSDIYKK